MGASSPCRGEHLTACWAQIAANMPTQSTSVDIGTFIDESEDYLISTFLNLEPDDSIWIQQNATDEDEYLAANVTLHHHHSVQTDQQERSVSKPPIRQQRIPKTQAKPRTAKINAEMWERMLPIISDLYSSHELQDILRILPVEHGFNPR